MVLLMALYRVGEVSSLFNAQELFDMLDVDKSGRINKDEFTEVRVQDGDVTKLGLKRLPKGSKRFQKVGEDRCCN